MKQIQCNLVEAGSLYLLKDRQSLQNQETKITKKKNIRMDLLYQLMIESQNEDKNLRNLLFTKRKAIINLHKKKAGEEMKRKEKIRDNNIDHQRKYSTKSNPVTKATNLS